MTGAKLMPGDSTAFDRSLRVPTNPTGTADGLYAESLLALRNQPPDWLEGCLTAIGHLSDLRENWNSYDASPVHVRSIALAKQWIATLASVTGVQRPRIAASPEGNVAFSWEWLEQARELDLEIRPNGILSYAYSDEQHSSQDEEGETYDPNLIAQLLTQW